LLVYDELFQRYDSLLLHSGRLWGVSLQLQRYKGARQPES